MLDSGHSYVKVFNVRMLLLHTGSTTRLHVIRTHRRHRKAIRLQLFKSKFSMQVVETVRLVTNVQLHLALPNNNSPLGMDI